MSDSCHPERADAAVPSRRGRNAAVLGGVGAAWLVLDMLTKSWFTANYAVGEASAGSILGLVRFHLVHNTGAAWGMFGDSTFALGIMSLVVCAVLAGYLIALSPRATLTEAIGVALVVAGGLGNAVDRFTLGYVVDFIEPVFIDFPVFNVADIGVTCGFVIFIIGLLLRERRMGAWQAAQAAAAPAGDDAPGRTAGSSSEGRDAR